MWIVWVAVGVLITVVVWVVDDNFKKKNAEIKFWKDEAQSMREELLEHKSPLYHVQKMKERGKV
jgi:deoxyribodipyrimidine photolyase